MMMAEEATIRRPEMVEMEAARGPMMAKPTREGGMAVTMVLGMMLSTPP